MIGLETVVALITKHGLTLLAPMAVVEGPIVTVIAAWLASRQLFDLWSVTAVVLLADMVGDMIWYGVGRFWLGPMPERWRRRLGLRRARLAALSAQFSTRGAKILMFGKWTHSAGLAVLVAAGAARMPAWRFFWVNSLISVPKVLIFVAIGYGFGAAYGQIDGWIFKGSALALGLIVAIGLGFAAKNCGKRRAAA